VSLPVQTRRPAPRAGRVLALAGPIAGLDSSRPGHGTAPDRLLAIGSAKGPDPDRLTLTVRRDAAPPPAAPERPAATAEGPQSMGEAAAEGAAEGARIGGLIGNLAIGGMMIRKGLQGVKTLPKGGWFAKAMPYLGIAFSAIGAIGAGRALIDDLQQPRLAVRPIAKHGMDLAGNLLVGGASIAVLAGAVAAPALLATGAGFLLMAAAGFMKD